MCRYALKIYKYSYVCFDCRVAFKRHSPGNCPNCGRELARMGLDFKAPSRNSRNQWRKVRLLYEAGITFDSCGCSGPGYRSKTLSEARSHIKAKSEEELYGDLLRSR